MTVHFIGAGPGAPDLITVRGLKLIQSCPVCLYAGSLVPEEIVKAAPAGARVIDTAPLHLDEIIAEIAAAHAKGHDVARVHSGDPSLYGAIAEQMRRLDELGIDYDVTPGVPAFAAAAAVLKTEFTLPEIAQTVILTRTTMQASAMPRWRDAGGTRPLEGDARHPSVDPQSRLYRARPDAALWRRLPGDRRLSHHLAGPADHPAARCRPSPRKCARRSSPAPR